MALINQSQSDAKFVTEEEKKKKEELLQYIYGYITNLIYKTMNLIYKQVCQAEVFWVLKK